MALVGEATALIHLLGPTNANSISAEAGGFFEAGVLSPGTASLQIVDNPAQARLEVSTGVIESGLLNRDTAWSFAGNFLIRPVPEPSSAVLLSIGLIGLGLRRRRRVG